jgi:hypothetical protein
VSGKTLLQLDEAELHSNLGLSKLQMRKLHAELSDAAASGQCTDGNPSVTASRHMGLPLGLAGQACARDSATPIQNMVRQCILPPPVSALVDRTFCAAEDARRGRTARLQAWIRLEGCSCRFPYCTLRVACCVLHAACCMLHVACCVMHAAWLHQL